MSRQAVLYSPHFRHINGLHGATHSDDNMSEKYPELATLQMLEEGVREQVDLLPSLRRATCSIDF